MPQHSDLNQQARTAYFSGRYVESRTLLIQALETLPPDDFAERAHVLSDLGDVYVNEDNLPKAEEAYVKSLEIYRNAGDKEKTALALRSLAAVYATQRRDDEAERFSKQALKIAREVTPKDNVLLSQVLNTHGVVFYRQGKFGKAEKLFKQSLTMIPESDTLYKRADLFNNLGAIYYRKRDFKRAEQYFLQGLKVSESQVGTAHPDLIFSLSSLATLYATIGDYAKAEQQYRRGLAILEPSASVFETRIARILQGLSRIYRLAGRKTEAESTLVRATSIARRNVSEHPDMANIMDDYASSLRDAGKLGEAEALRVEARRARVAAGLVVNAHHP